MTTSSTGAAVPLVVDTHFHLDHGDFQDDAGLVWQRARDAGISWGITIGTDPEVSGPAALQLSETHPRLYAAVGLHPHEADKGNRDEVWAQLERLAQHPRVVALGEMGLDFHYDFSPRHRQEDAFRRQLALARRLDLPIILHVRDAYEETLRLLEQEGVPSRGGVFHCFSAGPETAAACVEMGFHLGFGGLVTFKNAADIQAAAQMVPAGRILLETDAPYLAPVPRRGKRNEPAFVRFVLTRLAALRESGPAELAAVTTENAEDLFQVPGPDAS